MSPSRLPRILCSSVVRSVHQGESHGGVYLVDLEAGSSEQVLDWTDANINWEGRGGDRGLRGIAFHDGSIYLAASDEVFVYDRAFDRLGSFRNPYLSMCHELFVDGDRLYLSSTGFDAVLEYDLTSQTFTRGWSLRYANALEVPPHVLKLKAPPTLRVFDPNGTKGPERGDSSHVNHVWVQDGADPRERDEAVGPVWRVNDRLEAVRHDPLRHAQHTAVPRGVLVQPHARPTGSPTRRWRATSWPRPAAHLRPGATRARGSPGGSRTRDVRPRPHRPARRPRGGRFVARDDQRVRPRCRRAAGLGEHHDGRAQRGARPRGLAVRLDDRRWIVVRARRGSRRGPTSASAAVRRRPRPPIPSRPWTQVAVQLARGEVDHGPDPQSAADQDQLEGVLDHQVRSPWRRQRRSRSWSKLRRSPSGRTRRRVHRDAQRAAAEGELHHRLLVPGHHQRDTGGAGPDRVEPARARASARIGRALARYAGSKIVGGATGPKNRKSRRTPERGQSRPAWRPPAGRVPADRIFRLGVELGDDRRDHAREHHERGDDEDDEPRRRAVEPHGRGRRERAEDEHVDRAPEQQDRHVGDTTTATPTGTSRAAKVTAPSRDR